MRNLILSLSLMLSSLPAHAYLSVMDNGEILPNHHYKLTGYGQILTENGGLNVASRFDAGINDEMGIRGIFGVGKTDLFFGGMLKWMPVPDFEDQPAVGVNAGLIYAKDGEIRDTTIRIEPLVSKRFNVDDSVLTPYASLPMGIRMRTSRDPAIDETTTMTWQLVVGSQLQLPQWKKMHFMAELGVNLDDALAHVAAGAVFYFDENGFSLN